MINWKETNTIGNYCIWKSHTCHITSSLLQHVLKMSSSSMNASGKRWQHSQTTCSATCILQGSVATVLKWGGQNYICLHRVFSWCCVPKILRSAYAARSYSKNKSGTFLWTTVYYAMLQTQPMGQVIDPSALKVIAAFNLSVYSL